jgi:hypothetical protein
LARRLIVNNKQQGMVYRLAFATINAASCVLKSIYILPQLRPSNTFLTQPRPLDLIEIGYLKAPMTHFMTKNDQ